MAAELSDYMDYGEVFGRYIDDPRYSPTRKQQAIRCPLPDHDDKNASFSLNLLTSKWQCFACGKSGNVVDFVSEMEGISTGDAYKELCERYNVPIEDDTKKNKKQLSPLTLDEYAEAKHIDRRFLASRFMLSDTRLGGVDAVAMPYLTKDAHQFRTRVRAGRKTMRWGRKGSAWEDGKTPLYGIHLLDEEATEVVLVEGESDTQSLVYMGIDAVGAAGASMFNDANAADLAGMDVIVHDDGDAGGKVFVAKVMDKLGREVKTFRCRDIDPGCKDPSDVLIKYGREESSRLLRGAIESACTLVPEKPIEAPTGYLVTREGVFKDGRDGAIRVTSTPITINSVVRCCETGMEKLEICYSLRGRQTSKVFGRDIALNARKVVDAMAPLGINVSSGNSREIVEYLTACDAELSADLPLTESTPHLGWVDDNRFAPMASGDLLLDLDDGLAQRAAFLKPSGELETWSAAMRDARINMTFRFLLASSFSSPLVRIVGGRPMFVHVWESSRGGKTAALKAALSVWGDPDRIMTTFRSTLNAMCSLAELMCDLPVGIDERQMLQGAKQQERVEETVYTLAGGHRKDRSTVTGGLQRSGIWNCVFLTTGEVPLLEASTMTGAATRTIELNEKPFASEADAKYMHDVVRRQHGTAGKVFIDTVISMGFDAVREMHDRMIKEMDSLSPYADMVSLVCVADYIASKSCFGEDNWDLSVSLGKSVLSRLKSSEDIDINRNAVEWIADWIARNAKDFDNSFSTRPDIGTRDGWKTMIYRTAIEDDLAKAGFNLNKTLKYMADHGLIECEGEGAKRRLTKKVMRKGVRARMISIIDRALDDYLNGVQRVEEYMV